MNIRTRTFLAGLLLAAVVGTNTAPVLADPILEDDAAGETAATAPTPDPSTTVPTTAPPTTAPPTTVPPTTAPPTTVAPTTVPVPTVPSTAVEAPAPPPPTAGSNREASAAAEAISAPVPLKSVHAGVSIYDPEWPHNDSCSGIVVPAGQVLYQFVGSSLEGATIAGTTLTSATWGVSQHPTTISGGSARWLVTTSFTSTPLDMYFTTDGTTSRTSELRVGFSCSGAVATTGSLTIAKAVAGFGIPSNPGPFTIAYDNGAGNSGSVSVVAGSSQTVSGLPPGTYTISEPNAPAGVDVSFAPAASVTVTAGNTTSVTVTNTYRDVTDPTVDLRTPPEGAVYDRFQAVVADFSCADEAGGSGIESCVGTVADGAAVPTGVLGSHEFTVTATDEAGNTTTVTHTYRVRDVTGPTVDLRTPAEGAVYDRFEPVVADFSCADEAGGSGIESCVGTVPDGDAVPTGTLGSHEFTVTATDEAGNTTTVTHTYRVRDVTDPTVDLRTPAEGAVYDRFQAVTADFSCADETGGSGIESCVGTVADGAAVPTGVLGSHEFTVKATDNAGNETTVTHTYRVRDVTDPTVDLRTPAEGAVYDRSEVVVADFSCADEAGGSGIDTCVGTVPDGDAVPTGVLGTHEFTVTATDEAGNETTVTHTYRVRDVTDPTVDLRTPPEGAVYDRFEPVTADFSCADEDGGSGIESCVGTVADGAAVPTGVLGSHEFTVTATDEAGNETTVTHTYRVRDVTDPTVDLRTPAEGAVYDRFEPVTADFSCADESGGSGIDTCVGTVADGAAVPTGVLGSHEFTVKATDDAGNETTVTHTYRVRDVTGPTVDLRTPPEGAVYDRFEVVVADFSCADEDGGSGIESCVGTVPDGDAVATGTLGSHEFTVTATDEAGNVTTVTHTYRVRDVTGPTVDLRTPPEGAVYDRSEVVVADFSCADEAGGSGIESCVGTVPDGDAVPTGVLGSHEFTVTATDEAGNVTTVTHTYRVRDVTDPTVDLRTPLNGAVYDRFQAVAADFSCEDEAGGSGIDTCVGTVPDGDAVDTSAFGSLDFTVTATDKAGNTTTVTHTVRVEDLTPPIVTLSTPADGATYDLNSSVSTDFSCEDPSGSGIESCVGQDGGAESGTRQRATGGAAGDPLDTSSPGTRSYTAIAVDLAGNSTAVTHTYTVLEAVPPPPAPPDDAVVPVPVPPTVAPPAAPPAPRPEPEPRPEPAPAVDDGECVSGIEVTAVQVGTPVTFVGPGALTSDHQVWIDDVPTPISIDGATLLVATDQLRPGNHRITAACRGEVLVDQSFSVFLGVGSSGTAGGLGGFFGIFIVFLSTGFLWRAGALSLAGLLSMRTRAQVGAAAAALVALAFLSISFMAPPHAAAAEDGEVTIESSVNGRPIEGATSNDPVRLYPDEPTTIGVTVHNGSDEDLRVGRVRLSGTSLGLTLIAYDIPVPLDVPAGEDGEVEIPLVLFDLDRQANGLVPGTVSIYDDTGTVVADESFTLDVRGSITSVMGLFGGVILLATLISLVVIGRHIATRTLPPSRFRRALRFGLTGVGIGLTMVIALAGLRIAAAEGEIWVPFALVPGVIGFVLGFISPGVLKIEDDEVDEAREELIRSTTGTAVGSPAG